MSPSTHVCIRPSWRYLLVQMEQVDQVAGQDKNPLSHMEPLLCRHLISRALEAMYGIVGSSTPVDLLRNPDLHACFILRCPAGQEGRLQTALSLFTSDPLGPHQIKCYFRIHGIYSTSRDLVLPPA